ncbi:hypothetical protein [Nannocystis bainbridge]|uniref:VWFA domain-containing protein n=1 Tax=Nannocystis bainbridge TaxID=2995303 RepID=A0ABT5DVP2_9BACT|nr:hypothetical protein [Nannocystis bainbridge]MDC0717651.1 hypothetical protein [Nannocystis bainbridge]
MARSMSHPVHLWLAWTLVVACNGEDHLRGSATDGSPPSAIPTSVTLPPGIFASESEGEATSAGATDKLDLADEPTGGEVLMPPGCDKVDFLFVIDNSNSMADEQSSLIASFPGFIAAIEQTLEADDYHLMTISTDDGDAGNGDEDCDFQQCICAPAPTCCQDVCDTIFKGTTCNGDPCDQISIDACEFQYGSGRQFDQYGARCPIADERRYMLASQPDLVSTFACTAGIGAFGSGDERPIHAALSALGDVQNGPGGCNEGFLRDDAILVLVIITDEEDDNIEVNEGSPGEPAAWYEAVVAAKHGVPDAAVVLGLVGDSNLPGGLCPPVWDPDEDGGEAAPRLQSFVDMFSGGVIGSVCAADYTPFFVEAVSVIDTACDIFVPVG